MADKKTWGATPHRPSYLGNARQAARTGLPTDEANTNAAQTVQRPQDQPQPGTDTPPTLAPAASNLAAVADSTVPGNSSNPGAHFHSPEMQAAFAMSLNFDKFMADEPPAESHAKAVPSGSGHSALHHFAEKTGLKLPKKPKLSISKPKFKLPEFKLGSITNHSPSRPAEEPQGGSAIDSPRPGSGWASPRNQEPGGLQKVPANTRFHTPRHRPAQAQQPVQTDAIIANLPAADATSTLTQDTASPSVDSDTGAPTFETVDPRAPQQVRQINEVSDADLDALIELIKNDLGPEPEKK